VSGGFGGPREHLSMLHPGNRLSVFRKTILVGAVGIELKATLKARKLLIPLDAKNAKSREFAQVRYTPGSRLRKK
jgi:hypothetical protein